MFAHRCVCIGSSCCLCGEPYTSRFKKNNCLLRDGREAASRRLTGSLEALDVPGIAIIWIGGVDLSKVAAYILGGTRQSNTERLRLELSHVLG